MRWLSVQNGAVSEAKLKQLEVDYDIDEVLEGVTGSIGEHRWKVHLWTAVNAAQISTDQHSL